VRKEAAYYLRMAYYFQQYLRAPVLPHPQETLRRNVAERESRFLAAVRPAVFENPASPYHQLFQLAGCTFDDLTAAIRRDGLEPTLARLRDAGVYLTHNETKGTVPVVRHGREIANSPSACDNPNAGHGMLGGSSGSRSAGSVTELATAMRVYREMYESLLREEHEFHRHSEVSLMPILPAAWGISQAALAARLGGRIGRWFTTGGTLRNAGHYRAVTRFLIAEARLLDRALPYPEYLDSGDFLPVVTHLADCANRARPAIVRGTVSAITRICAAAREAGIDIASTVFLSGGEALTDARRHFIESLGCQVFSRYVANETGPIGVACRHMNQGNTVHLFSDSIAVIVHQRPAPLSDIPVDSLHFTTLNPLANRVFINAEIDDAGRLIPAACDCAFARAGFTTALTDIHSFGKLTGFGMTLVGTQLLPLLEVRLPQRFGGSPADFQLVESTGERHMELKLHVHPRLHCDPHAVRDYFLDQVTTVFGGALTRRTWEHAQNFSVVNQPPFATRTGKILPLHLASFGGSS
jgi:hypothetical protein